jgi:hypothetical protein
MFSVRYEVRFYIPEDSVPHSHMNFKLWNIKYAYIFCVTFLVLEFKLKYEILRIWNKEDILKSLFYILYMGYRQGDVNINGKIIQNMVFLYLRACINSSGTCQEPVTLFIRLCCSNISFSFRPLKAS